ncbi:MAG: 2Fe-2S iron-sulfur cluster binding domain-containing protein [Acidimicrobiia bacterium]|nr:2Fe-2S iron-sulfur cluster binding domain-containing protein [Acidimicrobiia bacterium]
MASVTFHEARVSGIDRMTDDAVCVTLSLPDDVRPDFLHVPGQHLTFRTMIDGSDVRRSYSICSLPGEPPSVGVKRLAGGTFSTFVNDTLAIGDVLEVTTPTGEFTLDPDPTATRHHVAFAAGSGITPVLSMVRSVLEGEPSSTFTIVYGNRTGQSVMFLDVLDDLKNEHPDRLMVFHVLSREEQFAPLLSGRIDADRVERLLATVIDAASVAGWYLCGPRGMVDTVRATLHETGIDERLIHDELFYAGDVTESSVVEDDVDGASVRFTLGGRTSTVRVALDGAPILDHVLSVRPDGPFSCRSGACASCRAVVVSGEVRMDRNWSLGGDEVDAGHILTCQAHPVSDTVEITYDV